MRRCASRCCAASSPQATGAPGEVLDDRLTIACGEGAIRLLEVQRAGKRPMGRAELLRGFALPKGERILPGGGINKG